MRIKLNVIIILMVIATQSFAKEVTVQRAANVAQNYLMTKVDFTQVKQSGMSVYLQSVKTIFNDTSYLVFGIQEAEGYVIVAKDDRVYPVLAYSMESSFIGESLPPGMEGLLNDYHEQIQLIKNGEAIARKDYSNEWDRYEAGLKSVSSAIAAPLLLTNWGQGYPYNEYCPEDTDGPEGHALVGCVALSMAMVMKYYDYPQQGTSSCTYDHYEYGTQSANFGNTQYYFENMPLEASQSNANLAEFLYHCGVAVKMDFGPDGSGSYVGRAADALEDYFGYSTSLSYIDRSDYSDAQWRAALKNEIDDRRPMIYRGYSGQYGHAWNCDGYSDDHFHMNWGWGGSYNGYFLLDQMVAGTYDFSGGHRAVININPNTNYPGFCGTTVELNGKEGSFGDGSGPENYHNLSDCYYEILPSCGQVIDVTFEMIDLGEGDTIYVYDAISSDGELIGKVYHDASLLTFNSMKGSMLLNFISDNSQTSNGWVVSYNVKNCGGTQVYSTYNGTISDGSYDCNYDNSRLCYWMIAPPSADSVSINFTEFDLYPDMDKLRIYKKKTSSDNQVAVFNSDNLPTTLVVNSDTVLISFFTNSSDNAGGWSLNYSTYSNASNIDDEELSRFSIYPNPASNLLVCEYETTPERIQIVNSLGSVVYMELNPLSDQSALDVSNLSPGIYFVHLTNKKDQIVKRFIKK